MVIIGIVIQKYMASLNSFIIYTSNIKNHISFVLKELEFARYYAKLIIELISTEKIETIISKNKKLLVSEDYFKILVKEGNKKLEKTWKKIDKLYKKISEI